MKLFNLTKKKLKEVQLKHFKLEKEIQSLIENNVDSIFDLEFISTEFTIDKYRIDSLCFDKENSSFVIIEYKKGNSYSVIDQGYTYLQLLLNNKSDFLLNLSKHYNKVMDIKDIDWSSSRIIFISQSFNSYQKDSINFKNLPFELWEIKKYSDNSIVLNQHMSTSKESIDSITNKKNTIISSVNKEVIVYDEEFHTSKTSKELNEVWNELKNRFTQLNDVDLKFVKHYIGLNYNDKKNICGFQFRKTGITMTFIRGNINTDGSKSKNYFTLDDPKKISNKGSWTWKSGAKGNVYKIIINKEIDIDYIMFLIKQKYKNITN